MCLKTVKIISAQVICVTANPTNVQRFNDLVCQLNYDCSENNDWSTGLPNLSSQEFKILQFCP